MKINLKTMTVLCTIFSFTETYACEFDVDCEPGSKCLKNRGSLYGVCAGGLFPGNSNDHVPATDSLDLDGTYGNTCEFDIDCGVSNKCHKTAGSITGVCLKGN